MNCPDCNRKTMVTDSRAAPDGDWRRRRKCLSKSCGTLFTTYERQDTSDLAATYRARLVLIHELTNPEIVGDDLIERVPAETKT